MTVFLGQGFLDTETHREEGSVKTWGKQRGREYWSRPVPRRPQEEPPHLDPGLPASAAGDDKPWSPRKLTYGVSRALGTLTERSRGQRVLHPESPREDSPSLSPTPTLVFWPGHTSQGEARWSTSLSSSRRSWFPSHSGKAWLCPGRAASVRLVFRAPCLQPAVPTVLLPLFTGHSMG